MKWRLVSELSTDAFRVLGSKHQHNSDGVAALMHAAVLGHTEVIRPRSLSSCRAPFTSDQDTQIDADVST